MNFFKTHSAEEKVSVATFVLCFLAYALISMTKGVYSASIAAIIEEGVFLKSQAGIINSGFFLFYGAMQLLGLKFVQKMRPEKYVSFCIAEIAVCLLGMSFAKNFYTMLILWCVCGFLQFAIWPATLRIISEFLLPDFHKKAMTFISFSYCTGSLINYALAAIVLKVSDWHMLFIVSFVILVVFYFIWSVFFRKNKETAQKIKKQNELLIKESLNAASSDSKKTPDGPSFYKLLLSSGGIFLLVVAFVRTCLDSGVKAWIPTMLVECYGIDKSFASMLLTLLIFINLGGVFFANFLYPKRNKNVVACLGITFLIALPTMFLNLLIGKISVLLIALLLTVSTTLMYSGHQFLNVLIPAYFAKYNKTGPLASVLNSFASFGVVISNTAFGIFAENFGWTSTIWSWIIICAVAIVFCFIASIFWKRFAKEQ